MTTQIDHYGDHEGLRLLSHNGVFNSVNTNRNFGKTWTFKKRAFKRAMKHHKKTIWLRVFKKEVKEALATFYKSADLQRYCGVSIYDKQYNPTGNLKQEGNTFYYRANSKKPWNWFLKVYCLSDADAVRSADDVDVDTIVLDEYTKTPEKLKRYRGNMVNDLIDIWFSAKREHEVKVILLGNKESINNPFFAYFGIKPLPESFEGIRTYKGGSFVVQQINNKAKDTSDFDKKVKALLSGTTYGNYIYDSQYKQQMPFKPRKMPVGATLYCQLINNSTTLRICAYNGFYYVDDKIDTSKKIYCDRIYNKYKNELLLVKRQRRFFLSLINALADNRVYFNSAKTHEAIQPFLQWLCI